MAAPTRTIENGKKNGMLLHPVFYLLTGVSGGIRAVTHKT